MLFGPPYLPDPHELVSSKNDSNTGRRALKLDPETDKLWSQIESVFAHSCLHACHERISSQFEDAFKDAHKGCIVERARGVSPRISPTDVHPYESAGRKFETLWSTLEIREYWRDIQTRRVLLPILPQPDCFSDDYWFQNRMADELRPVRDAVREFLKTIGVVKEYHCLLATIISDFLNESSCEDRQEPAEKDPIAHSFRALFDGRPVPILLPQLREEFPEEDPETLLILRGYPYVLSELNRQLEPGSEFSEFIKNENTLEDSIDDEISCFVLGLTLLKGRDYILTMELGTWDQWRAARAISDCPISAGRWEQDIIVPAALKLISVSNPSYDRSRALIDGKLTITAKKILGWSLAQYNLMFLQGLLAKMADRIKGCSAASDAPDTVKTLQQTVHSHYQAYYETWKPDKMPESLDDPLPEQPLLAGVTSQLFNTYARFELITAASYGDRCSRHGQFDAARTHYQEALQFACNIEISSKFDATLWTRATRDFAINAQAETLNAIADLDAKQGKNLEAGAKLALHALQLKKYLNQPPDPFIHHTLGLIYLRQGKAAAALKHLKPITKLDFHAAPALLLDRGDAYRDTEQHQEAKTDWQEGWRIINTPEWQEHVKNALTPFEAQQEEAFRKALRERLGIQENDE